MRQQRKRRITVKTTKRLQKPCALSPHGFSVYICIYKALCKFIFKNIHIKYEKKLILLHDYNKQ